MTPSASRQATIEGNQGFLPLGFATRFLWVTYWATGSTGMNSIKPKFAKLALEPWNLVSHSLSGWAHKSPKCSFATKMVVPEAQKVSRPGTQGVRCCCAPLSTPPGPSPLHTQPACASIYGRESRCVDLHMHAFCWTTRSMFSRVSFTRPSFQVPKEPLFGGVLSQSRAHQAQKKESVSPLRVIKTAWLNHLASKAATTLLSTLVFSIPKWSPSLVRPTKTTSNQPALRSAGD